MLVAVQLSVPGLYLPPVFKYAAAIISAPDDHLTAGPNCRVYVSRSGRIGGAGGCPAISAGIVSPASVQRAAAIRSAPDDHLTAGPNCRVGVSRQRAHWWCWWLSSYQCWDCISRQCSKSCCYQSAPDDHLTASPHCRVIGSGSGRIGGAGGCPTVSAGIVSPASVKTSCRYYFRPRRSSHCRSRLPCGPFRASGALVVLVAVQVSSMHHQDRNLRKSISSFV